MSKNLSYRSPFFSLKIRQNRKSTAIDMQMTVPFVNTRDLPQTLDFLREKFPSVLKTQCFNESNLPFAAEVKETEIGHLFEHILIDVLCGLKIKRGAKSAELNGNTSWNWIKNPAGSFHIWIDLGKDELQLLIDGLNRTIKLSNELIEPTFQALLLPTKNLPTLRVTALDHPQIVN